MDETLYNLIMNYDAGGGSLEEIQAYFQGLGISVEEASLTELTRAWETCDAEALEMTELLIRMAGPGEEVAQILGKILLEDWHYLHERIADLFSEYRCPGVEVYLAAAAVRRYRGREYDYNGTLSRKCYWALYHIKGRLSGLLIRDISEKIPHGLRSECAELSRELLEEE